MNSRDIPRIHPKRDLLEDQRRQQIGSNIVHAGANNLRVFKAAQNFIPQNKTQLVNPRQQIQRGSGTWEMVAPRDSYPGFIPKHIITDREIELYKGPFKG